MKTFFYFLCIFFLVTLNANSEKISKIEIQGNKRISNETIKLFSGVNEFKDKSLTENDLNLLLKQLYETNFFQNVNINLKNNILTINVIENPLIQNVKFEGIKNKEDFYFVHSYICKPNNQDIILSKTEYGGINFCSSIQQGSIYGCQFHPEKSAASGLKIIKNFINIVGGKK